MIPAQIPTKKAAILCILGHLLGGERVRHEGHFTSGIIYLHPLGYSALRTFGKCLMDAIGIYLVDKDALMEVKNGYSHVSLVEDRGYPSISVVIPARNEAQNLQYVLPRIPSMVSEVILVDGLSTDETIEVARRVLPDIRIIKQTGKGKGNALRAGFAACTGDIVVTLDADGSADPKEIPYFMAALMLGNDFAKGSRFVKGGGSSDITRFRRLGNFCLNKIVNVLYLAGFSDLCYGYNAFWKYCLDHIDIDCDGFEIETLMVGEC